MQLTFVPCLGMTFHWHIEIFALCGDNDGRIEI